MSICHWEDPSINKEWRGDFEKDPWTSQRSYWDEWDFFPARRDRYRCIAENNMYQLIVLWILWVGCDLNSELCKKGRRLGIWRAVADISEEELGSNICAYSESEVADALAKRPSVMYYATQEDAGGGRGESY
ncbi:hypothetical protein DL95DRAFT_412706 [Leptodontidium sp. 2 PMI_412]|nr:hypothetical protein DL95DRAFT_412706 [Leptodontidium sp. 2 PMI_412]